MHTKPLDTSFKPKFRDCARLDSQQIKYDAVSECSRVAENIHEYGI
jgi:hypothetical protein